MSRLALALALALFLGLPASGQAKRRHPPSTSDGCFVVADGQGSLTIAARGGIFGRFDTGQLIVDELQPGAGTNPQVFGAQEVQTLSTRRTKYVGVNVRFHYEGGGAFRLTLIAIGIDLSAVGRGSAILDGAGFANPGSYSADTASLCASKFKPLPTTPTKVLLGAQTHPSAGRPAPRHGGRRR
jgi:hypothetical protein